jgi:hypothetical protein
MVSTIDNRGQAVIERNVGQAPSSIPRYTRLTGDAEQNSSSCSLTNPADFSTSSHRGF